MSILNPFVTEPLPWRLSYLGDPKLLSQNSFVFTFTPVLSWALVINPFDRVELVNPYSLTTELIGRACWSLKMRARFITKKMLSYWRSDIDDPTDMLKLLNKTYKNGTVLESPILVLCISDLDADLNIICGWDLFERFVP